MISLILSSPFLAAQETTETEITPIIQIEPLLLTLEPLETIELVTPEPEADIVVPEKPVPRTSIALRSAAFFPSNQIFRDIYGSVEPDFQIELTFKRSKILAGWINFDQLCKSGGVSGGCGSSSVNISNLSGGIKFVGQPSSWFQIYLGAGPNVGGIFIHNESACKEEENLSRLGLGLVVKSGANINLGPNLFIDLFADYLYEWANLENCRNIGGFKTGLGIGFRIPFR